ncbi:MAG: hypothetical protein HYW45_04140 [Candidatus Daviesbacteria bacterium]|nr:MAG: hypothetical protein HYW45_04140 [Candidatus Daviesbacteria bacterium]
MEERFEPIGQQDDLDDVFDRVRERIIAKYGSPEGPPTTEARVDALLLVLTLSGKAKMDSLSDTDTARERDLQEADSWDSAIRAATHEDNWVPLKKEILSLARLVKEESTTDKNPGLLQQEADAYTKLANSLGV